MSFPPFFGFRSFRSMCIVAIALFALLSHELRVQYIAFQIRQSGSRRLLERLRTARVLHDSLLQGMHALVLQLHFAIAAFNADDPKRDLLATALERAEDMTAQARTQLQSIETATNLNESLPQELAQMVGDLGLGAPEVRVNQYGRERSLRPLVRMTIYRSLREGLTNSLDHARATRVDLDLEYSACGFGVRFRDDGVGFAKRSEEAQEEEGFSGLRRIRDSILSVGGHLEVRTAPGAGTEIEIHVPASLAYGRPKHIG
jgi:signal transduction histidine kinase